MTLFLLLLGLLALGERVSKYLLISWFFKQHSLTSTNNLTLKKSTVSIMQPILSGDPTLWDCLSRNLQMKTAYEIDFLWLIDDDDDGAQRGCRELIAQYPDVKINLISLAAPSAEISPKTFKLIEGLKQAQGEIIVFLDDDTILPDYGLEKALPFLEQSEVGVAFGLPYYINFSNVWSTLVSAVVNGNNLLTYIPYTFVTQPFTINGMFFAIKREILDKVNGFSGLETAIVDDFAIAQKFRDHGYQLVQTPLCHGISTQIEDISHYFNILIRWFIFPQESIMKSVSNWELFVFYTMAFIPTLAPLAIILYSCLFPSIYSLVYSIIYFLFSYFMLNDFNQNYFRNATPNSKIIVLLVVQILLPINLIIALLSPRRINWRGNIMELKKNGEFELIKRRTTREG